MTSIVEHGWTTTAKLAEEFDLTPEAIRLHLQHLEEAGMVTVRIQPASLRTGAGRPSKEFSATAKGRESLSQTYDTVAISAIETLEELGGEQAVTRFFEQRFEAIETRFAELIAEDASLPGFQALSMALNEDGFIAGIMPTSQNMAGTQLCQHQCPYPAIAVRFPQLCSVETSIFSRLLDSHVQRLATIAHGDGVCTTHIPAPMRKENQ